jgi:cell division transport system permease protein
VAEPWDAKDPSAPRIYAERTPEPIVQSGSIAGRSLTAVVAIMTFLAALTTGAVMMVVSAANDWQSDVGREITIQVRPVPGRDIEADVRAAVDIAPTPRNSRKSSLNHGSAPVSRLAICQFRA